MDPLLGTSVSPSAYLNQAAAPRLGNLSAAATRLLGAPTDEDQQREARSAASLLAGLGQGLMPASSAELCGPGYPLRDQQTSLPKLEGSLPRDPAGSARPSFRRLRSPRQS